jgi:hypothetical protein
MAESVDLGIGSAVTERRPRPIDTYQNRTSRDKIERPPTREKDEQRHCSARLRPRLGQSGVPRLRLNAMALVRTAETMTSLTNQLRRLEERLARREVESRDELADLLAEGFLEHGASGRVYSRADALDSYELGHPTDVELFDFGLSMLGPDAALATYGSREADGRRAHRASVWVREEGRWRMLFHQGTVTREDAP